MCYVEHEMYYLRSSDGGRGGLGGLRLDIAAMPLLYVLQFTGYGKVRRHRDQFFL